MHRGNCYQHIGKTPPQTASPPAKPKKRQDGRIKHNRRRSTRTGSKQDAQQRPVRDGTNAIVLNDSEALRWLCESLRRHTAGMGNGLNSFQAMQNYHGLSALGRLTADNALPYGVRTVFGGGTCLALGHRLTERYSEDIDVVLVGARELGDNQRAEVLDAVRTVMLSADGVADIGGRRNQHFVQQEISYLRTVEDRSLPNSRLKVRVDAGFADQLPDGDITTVNVETFLSLRGDRTFASHFRDLHSLEVRAVKPRLVLIEKMIALHQRGVAGQEAALRSRARDVFDIGCLLDDEPTLVSLSEPGFSAADIDHRQMQRDQKTPTTTHRSKRLQVRRPPGGFAESLIWRPGNPMHEALKQSYNSMGGLVYDKSKKPRFENVVQRVHDVQNVL